MKNSELIYIFKLSSHTKGSPEWRVFFFKGIISNSLRVYFLLAQGRQRLTNTGPSKNQYFGFTTYDKSTAGSLYCLYGEEH
ncbi:hypothetical protein J27TS8_42640 [Robertmurraya siralis]|uniref:Uncharacterized protein n=1 Tax=Robertmurraya siralis TaxID=77777 RepID=A0A919WLF5_9BACI|nr:hypothetical protein J27TS8_42640 [Robertmurraya siralis]